MHALDEFFHRKYEDVGEGDQHELRQVATAEEIIAEQEAHADAAHPHAVAVVLADRASPSACRSSAYGVIFNHVIAVVGARRSCCWRVFGWALEPSVATDADYDPPPDDGAGEREHGDAGATD